MNMQVDASCNQCGHELDAGEIFGVCIGGECPACGCGGDVEGEPGSGPFSYDPMNDYKTEQ